jgi:uncharacterized protein with PQ loop repeat
MHPAALTLVPAGVPPTGVLLLVGATALSAAAALLMLRTSVLARTSSGLSTGLLVLSLASYPMWLAYGWGNGNLLQVGCNAAWTAALVAWWVFWAADRRRSPFLAGALVVAWTTALLAGVAAGVPHPLLGWAATVTGVAAAVPQVVAMVRADSLGDGFSLPGWSVAVAQLGLWLGYALLAGDGPVGVGVAVALLLNVVILARAVTLRSRG